MTATILTRLKELARDMVGEPLDADQHVDLRAGELRDIIQAVEAMGERPTVVNYVERIQYHAERADTAEADLATLRAEMDEAVRAKDGAYEERNQMVAALARLYPSGIARTDIPGWEPEWHGCVYIDLPTGQVSWHFHDSQAHLFDGLPPYTKPWDGHDTPEKYRRVAALSRKGDDQ